MKRDEESRPETAEQALFGTIRLAVAPTSMLLDRLRIRLPEGSFTEPRTKAFGGITGGTKAMLLKQTAGFIGRDGLGLNVLARDDLRTAREDIDAVARCYAEPIINMGKDWQLSAATHPAVRVLVPTEVSFGPTTTLAIAVIKHLDGSLLAVHVQIDGSSARKNLPACRRLAEAIAGSAEPGTRRLLTGPLRLVCAHGAFDLPAGYTARVDRGFAFMVVLLDELGSGEKPTAAMQLYFGGHPSFHFKRRKEAVSPEVRLVEVLGNEVERYDYPKGDAQGFETIAPLGNGHLVHVTSSSFSPEQAQLHMDTLGSLTVTGDACDSAAPGAADLDVVVAQAFTRALRVDLQGELRHATAAKVIELTDQIAELQEEEAALDKRVTEQFARIDAEREQAARADQSSAERQLVGALLEGVREAHQAFDDVAAAITSLDERIGRQLDLILHHPTLQALEARWRGLYWLATTATKDRRVRVEMLNCSKEDLLIDFEDSAEVACSGLYRMLYTAEYGGWGGTPYSFVMADYAFAPSKRDMRLLSECLVVAAACHAPFVASASPALLGVESLWDLGDQQQLELSEAGQARWQELRREGEARHGALFLGRVLLRAPYGSEEGSYRERISGPEDLLWGSAAVAVGVRLAASHELAGGGLQLAGAVTPPGTQGITPLEVVLSEEQRARLADLGISTLKPRPDAEGAELIEAPSLLAPSAGKDPRDAQLGILLLVARVGQLMKVMQREKIGSWKNHLEIQQALHKWLLGFVVGVRRPGRFGAGWRPFCEARLEIHDLGRRGYRFELGLTPNWAERGGPFTITLEGKLDKE